MLSCDEDARIINFVISNKAKMLSNTWAVPSSYGWGGQDSAILNCAVHAGLNSYLSDLKAICITDRLKVLQIGKNLLFLLISIVAVL